MKKLGTFNGVFVPSFEAILGAVLFLLLPHLTAEVGLWPMLGLVVLAHVVTTATAFSIRDCTASLGRIGAGGMYALSKGSLGMAFGGSIGIQLYLAQAASIGFYAIGFATPLRPLLFAWAPLAEWSQSLALSPLAETQAIATVLALAGLAAGLVGSDFVSKLQLMIFVILGASVGAFFAAPALGLTYNGLPLFNPSPQAWAEAAAYSPWAALLMFFPAVTGIDAGVGMSGSLKQPRRSLSLGTFSAIAVTFTIYAGLTVVFSFFRPELLSLDAGGAVPSILTYLESQPVLFGIILTGILVATASSALSYFITAPHTAKALVDDNVLPRALHFLGRDFISQGHEPRWAVLMTFGLTLAVIWSGDVAASARLVGIAFLMVYGWTNLAAFLERLSGNPSFRPAPGGHWLISLGGFVLTLTLMALDSLVLGLAVLGAQALLFWLLLRFKGGNRLEGVWWGVVFRVLTWAFRRLRRIIQGTKNWRPVTAAFAFADESDQLFPFLRLGKRLAGSHGLVSTTVLPGKAAKDLEHRSLPPETVLLAGGDEDPNEVVTTISLGAVIGGLKYNTVLLPFDNRFRITSLLERLIQAEKHVLLYKSSLQKEAASARIDLWWRGEENGALMALLASLVARTDREQGGQTRLRLIRQLEEGEEAAGVQDTLVTLLDEAHLEGEVVVLPGDKRPFRELLEERSRDAELIMLGMPGRRSGALARFFQLDKLFFEQEVRKFDRLPPILFVKAAGPISLRPD